MNSTFTLIMLAGLGALLWTVKANRTASVLAGGLLVVVLVAAGINFRHSMESPPAPETEKKNLVIEALGWRTGQLVNEDFGKPQEILVLRPSGSDPSPSHQAPHELMMATLLQSLGDRHQVNEHRIELPPMALEGFTADQLAAALEAHPSTDVIVSLVGPPNDPDKMRELVAEEMPCFAVCFGDNPRLQDIVESGLLTALAPRAEVSRKDGSPEALYEDAFNTYCAIHSKEP